MSFVVSRTRPGRIMPYSFRYNSYTGRILTFGLGLGLCPLLAHSAQAAQYWVDYENGSDSYDGSGPTHTTGNVGPFKTIYHATGTQTKRALPGDTVCVLSTASLPHQGIAYGGAVGNPITFDGSGCGYNVANGLPAQAKIVGDDTTHDALYINTRTLITSSAAQPSNNSIVVASLNTPMGSIVTGSIVVNYGAASLPSSGVQVTGITGSGPYTLSLSGSTSSTDPASTQYLYVPPTRAHDLVIQNFEITAASSNTARAGINTGNGVYNLSILGNFIHDVGGNGINCFECDRTTISGNAIANAATYTCSAHNSGISILGPTDIDPNSGQPNGGDATPAIKIVISNNYIYSNYNKLCGSATTNSDGSGVISPDDGDNVYGPSNSAFPYSPGQWFDPAVYTYGMVAYHGQIAVTNNVVFGNGGPGIHSYKWTASPAGGLVVMHNTLIYNVRDPNLGSTRAGEIGLNSTPNAVVLNNVIVTDGATSAHTGQHTAIQLANGSTNATVKNNWMNSATGTATLIYTDVNSSVAVNSGNQTGDPLLSAPPALSSMSLPLSASVIAATNLRPQTSSSVFGLGDTSMYSVPTDVLIASRDPNHPTLGSYEH